MRMEYDVSTLAVDDFINGKRRREEPAAISMYNLPQPVLSLNHQRALAAGSGYPRPREPQWHTSQGYARVPPPEEFSNVTDEVLSRPTYAGNDDAWLAWNYQEDRR
jgi:hypothetical protein